MDILSNLTNLLGGAAAGQSRGGQGGGMDMGDALGALGGLFGGGAGAGGGLGGALTGMLGSALGGGGARSGAAGGAGGDPLGGIGSLVGALLGGGGRGGAGGSALSGLAGLASGMAGGGGSGAGAGAGLGGIGALIGTLMGGQGGSMLSSLLGGEAPPPAPQANMAHPGDARAANTLRALVYAARADGKLDAQEKQSIAQNIQQSGLSQAGQDLVNTFLTEDVDPSNIARNITSPQEALQIYALSCAITRMDSFMEKNYLDALAQSLRIPPQTKAAIEQKIAG